MLKTRLLALLLCITSAVPAPADDEGPGQGAYRTVRDIAYRDGQEQTPYMLERCRLDVYAPADAPGFATVVWFHAGGLTSGRRFVPEALQGQGIAVVAVDYRLSPTVQAPAYIEDAAAAVAWTLDHIQDYGGDPDKVFLAGHSAGGYLVSMVGLDRRWLAAHDATPDRLAGVVPFSGHTITHFTVRKERDIPGTRPVVDDLAPLYHVRPDAPPMLLITGDRELEMLGRYEENAYFWRMMRVAGHEHTTLHELEGYDHGQMPQAAYPLLLRFIQDRLEPDADQ